MSASGGNPLTPPSPSSVVVGYSTNIANAAATATLPAVAGKTNYLTGFIVTADAPTAAIVANAAVSGIAVPFTLTQAFPAAPAIVAPVVVTFAVPIPAAAANQAINVTLSALGAGSANARVIILGFTV